MSAITIGTAVAVSVGGSPLTIGTTAAVAIGASPLLLILAAGIVAGGVTWGIISACNDKDESEKQDLNETRKNQLLQINCRITHDMAALIDALSDASERKLLMSQLNTISNKLQADIENYRKVAPDSAFREIRQRILSAQMDEKAAAANKSLAGLVEEKYTIPPSKVLSQENKRDKKLASLVSDIVNFGARIAFFDENEARKIHPLVDEAASGKAGRDELRLTAIRQEIKMRYGKLKEQKILTEMFKQEIHEMLPLVKRARDAETLIVRMDELMTAGEVSRADFTPLYEDAKIFIAGQLESITDKIVMEKVSGALNEMGYTLVGEDGQSIAAQDVNYVESPYDGYQVQVKIDKGALATRLVRVVGSEEEKNAASEYQRQKDIETGRKWCRDLDVFHEKMKSEGIEFNTKLRKEPEEEPLRVIVKAGGGKKRKRVAKAAARSNSRRSA